MPTNKDVPRADVDRITLIWGFVFGALVGGVAALLGFPKQQKPPHQQVKAAALMLKDKLEAVVPTDPVEDSMSAGKAAAKRRRDELGLKQAPK